MALPKSAVATNNITLLNPEPNDVQGLTDALLQAKFDQYGIDNNLYINNTLTPAQDTLNASLQTQITDKDAAQTSALTTHKASADHDVRYYTETELNSGQLDNRYYTETESDAKYETMTDLSVTRKLSSAGDFTGTLNGGPILASDPGLQATVMGLQNEVTAHLADDIKHLTSEERTTWNEKLTFSTDIAKFKSGNSSYTDNDTAQTFTDAFCTASSLVTISITSGTKPQGTWVVTSASGSFTITSSVAESTDITFDYFITKVV